MTKKQVVRLEGFEGLQTAIGKLKALNLADGWEVEIRPATTKRSLNQNDLFWMWMDLLAKYLSNTKAKYNKNDIYAIVVHKFLGYEDLQIGNTRIENQLRSTKALSKEEFFHFMTQIDEWAISLGCLLPTPEGSQHHKIKQQNV